MNTRENYYIDAVAGRYERVFPLAHYADAVDLGDVESVRASLSSNLWFRLSDDARRRSMIDKVAKLKPAVDELCALVRLGNPPWRWSISPSVALTSIATIRRRSTT